MRVLLANEPRAYREALAGALRDLRPLVEFYEAEPEALEPAVESLRPRLVLCSRLPASPPPGPRGWIELYPGGDSSARLSLDGRLSTLGAVQLDDLLSVVDRTEDPVSPD